jgi:YfiH family protein
MAGVRQVHGNDVAVVRTPGIVSDHDALVSDVPDLLLTVVAADCALILLADATAGVIGACHSGWRGTVGAILPRTLGAMTDLGADPARVNAWIGPCISAESFEVGEEVAARFAAAAVVRRAEWPRPHIDLRSALLDQLGGAGVSAEQVEVDDRCPALDTSEFYSYRAENGTRGRMIGYIGRRGAS